MGVRVGLTGGLGSGKSTVARMFAELGVYIISADEIGRELMRPGTSVYDAVVSQFGPGVVRADKSFDRKALAKLAFDGHRIEELNRIIHPAVIAAQDEWTRGVFAKDPGAIAMVESALIFEADRSSGNLDETSAQLFSTQPGLRARFDKLILVTVPDDQKISRYVARLSPGQWDESVAADARRRLAAQIPDNEKIAGCDYVIQNSGPLAETAAQVEKIFHSLSSGTGPAVR